MRSLRKIPVARARVLQTRPGRSCLAAGFWRQRVRHSVAKLRHNGKAARDARLCFSHSSAQARMRSREARGSMGGGVDVSTGGSARSAAPSSALGAAGAGDCFTALWGGAGSDGVDVPDFVTPGFFARLAGALAFTAWLGGS